MTTQHTPGPWSLETVNTFSGICHKVGPFPPGHEEGKPRHACLYADYPSDFNPADQELLANARLIASAPELLRYLSIMFDSYENGKPCYIDGADGEYVGNAFILKSDDFHAIANLLNALDPRDTTIAKATQAAPG